MRYIRKCLTKDFKSKQMAFKSFLCIFQLDQIQMANVYFLKGSIKMTCRYFGMFSWFSVSYITLSLECEFYFQHIDVTL